MNKYILLLLLSSLIACSVKKTNSANKKTNFLQNIAQDHFGEKYAVKPNESGTYSLVFRRYKKLEDLFQDVRYFIFDHATASIIFEDELKQGSVNWHSDLEIMAISRKVSTENSNDSRQQVYYFNVLTKEKRNELR